MSIYVLPDGTKEFWSSKGLHRKDGPAVERSDGTKEFWVDGFRHRETGPAYEGSDGGFSYWRHGLRHREDGPAIVHADGFTAWYRDDVLHREDGPALEYPDGTRLYFQDNLLHREDGPAVERPDDSFDKWNQGKEEWRQQGVLHREDGPAITHQDGYQAYYRRGVLHREDGPARMFPDGSSEHYEHGKLIKDEEGGRTQDLSKQDVVSFYETGTESDRLHGSGFPTLEFERARRMIMKLLPEAPISIADIGGGPGVYSGWMASLGHDVIMIEPVPEHIRLAKHIAKTGSAFRAVLGDAMSLPMEDESVDFVVMFGPLYHLQDEADRLKALQEAWRVLRPGGKAIISALNRYVPFVQGIDMNLIDLPSYRQAVTGFGPTYQGSNHPRTPRAEWFEIAYGHSPSSLRNELETSGWTVDMVSGKEGPAWAFRDEWPKRMRNADEMELMLWSSENADAAEDLAVMSSHLIAVVGK